MLLHLLVRLHSIAYVPKKINKKTKREREREKGTPENLGNKKTSSYSGISFIYELKSGNVSVEWSHVQDEMLSSYVVSVCLD